MLFIPLTYPFFIPLTYLFFKKAKVALALEPECVGSVGNEATAAAGIYFAFLSFMNSVS
jgi:hypothetical protein